MTVSLLSALIVFYDWDDIVQSRNDTICSQMMNFHRIGTPQLAGTVFLEYLYMLVLMEGSVASSLVARLRSEPCDPVVDIGQAILS